MKMINVFKYVIGIILVTGMVGIGFGHDDGHNSPDRMPPFGPHGGKYTKLTRHYGEIVVRGRTVTVYILERDIKNVAEDATGVSLVLEIPGRSKKRLRLVKKGEGYQATINIPRQTRRVYFHIRCVLDKKGEYGKILYEPSR